MRILVASIRGASGIATYTASVARGLASAGHEVVLLDEGSGFEAGDPRISVVELGPSRRLPGPLEPLESWSLRGDVRRLADDHAVDAIHITHLGLTPRAERVAITAWDPVVGPAGRFRAAPDRGANRRKEALYAVADTVAVRRAGAIVAVTAAVKSSLDRFGKPCEHIPAFLPDGQVGPARGRRPHDVVMVAAAIDSYRKGLDLAVDAVGRVRESVPDARLILVGGWVDVGRQQALPGFCQVRGKLTSEEVRATFEDAGCCLLPSRWEEVGYTGLEALAAGIPVACAPLPAYDGISGGGVFMAPRREAGLLAERIVEALDAIEFEYPSECRASTAIPRLVDLYGHLAASR